MMEGTAAAKAGVDHVKNPFGAWCSCAAGRVNKRGVSSLMAAMLLSACSAFSQPTATTQPTATATAAATVTAPPSYTPVDTATLTPAYTPTTAASPTAAFTWTPSHTATITPLPAVGFVFDNWEVVELPQNIKDGIANPMIAFTNSNNRQTIANIATARPNTGIETFYLVSPARPSVRIPILEVDSSTRARFFLAKSGKALSFVKAGADSRSNGLYILDLESGFSARVLPGDNPLTQRGFFVEPDWSPDGSRMAMAVATGYDMDIFLYPKDGSGRTNITAVGSYDWWPRWSPDGRFLSFVSDRAICPSWIPGDANFCDALTADPPSGGQVYALEVDSGVVMSVSDIRVTEPPYWITSSLLAFASGDQFDLLNPQRRIWQANIITGSVTQVRLPGSLDSTSYLAESWSPDGQTALVQIADALNQIALMTADGQLLQRDSQLDFPRFGMSAAWSPDGERIAVGGSSGQCPYGVRVKRSDYSNIATGNPPPSMCDPQFSHDGQFIAFTGVNPRVDGRNDVYAANSNGFGVNNLTADLRGQVELIGWVGG